jgi:hypothetical protein
MYRRKFINSSVGTTEVSQQPSCFIMFGKMICGSGKNLCVINIIYSILMSCIICW